MTTSPSDIRERLNILLKRRDEIFPRVDDALSAGLEACIAEYAEALQPLRRGDCESRVGLLGAVRECAEDAVFIGGFMKSGTTLLVNLLDGHDNLVVMPGDSHMVKLVDEWRGLPDVERVPAMLAYWLRRAINPTGQSPFWVMGDHDAPYAELMDWIEYWHRTLDNLDQSCFLSVVLAWFCANPQRAVSPSAWIAKTPGNEFLARPIRRVYPEARFIQVVREPSANIASVKRLYTVRGWEWDIESVAWHWRRSAEAVLGGDGLVVPYERLVSETENAMAGVAKFVGIPTSGSLLTPTINSLPAQANSMYSHRRGKRGVLPVAPDSSRSGLDARERDVVTHVTQPVARRLGYPGSWIGFQGARIREKLRHFGGRV